MKQVLCLDILIDEEEQAVQQEREVVLTRPWESDASDIESFADEDQTRTRSSPLVTNALLLKDAPLKNTFIHYDVPGSLDADLSPPTTSAPAVLLRRLFKTRAHSAPACAKSTDGFVSEEDSATHVSSLESVDVFPTNVQDAKEDDLQDYLEKDSQVSTSAPPSIAGSPMEDIPGMQASFGPDVEQLATELHDLGQCTPCNYFWYKVDGCRQGSACSFCHLCPKGELKKRKKDRLKELRAAGILRRR